MIELFGKHKISSDFVKSLSIDCLSLDIVAFNLFVDGIHFDGSARTKQIYEEKLSTSLLSLVVAVRTLLYQGIEDKVPCPNVTCCGFYESKNPKDKASLSVKDICDKIIHADSIARYFEKTQDTDQKPVTIITGEYHNKSWNLEISISLFCESILNWMDELEKHNKAN
jgi:hypothetical protein